MMMQDGFGNTVSTTSEETIDAINRFSNSLIGYGTDFPIVFEQSDADPDCAVLAALATQLGLFLESPDRLAITDKYLTRAVEAAPRATRREQLFVEAMLAHRNADYAKAISCHRKLAAEFPEDLLSAKIGQTLYFNLGNDEGMLWLADQVLDAHQDNAYAHGMRAFGLEQMSRLEEAEEEGRKATEMKRCEPWAHHAVAHVMITQGRLDDGIQWMQTLSDEWDGCNSFMYTHNWWHLALFHLEKEEFDEALSLYDRSVWGREKTYSQDQINAISLLWRLELAGVDVGDRWMDVANYVADRSFNNDQPFLDMQYIFALARGGKDEAVQGLLAGMYKQAKEGPAMTRTVWGGVAVPAAEAFVAYAKGEFGKVIDLLGPARVRMQSIGGSHAQRDLFEQVWIDSLLKVRDFETVMPLIEKRLEFRHPVKLDQTLMMRARNAQSAYS
ncbi:tetratricopeptide repeat protein [Sneathiella sp.]|jgi:tetratricopeptide (TPR) repeat protein|uniref:tetratricopeptide repeat protein n=1 Tax=Sneathiella sp. TaxID=1964365 RepID=UPI0039E4A4FA